MGNIVYLQSKIFPEKTLIPMETPPPGLAEYDIITRVFISKLEKKHCNNKKCRAVFYPDSRKINGLKVGPHDKCIDCMISDAKNQELITSFLK